MPNFCTFTLRAAGPGNQVEAYATHWNAMMRETKSGPDANGFTVSILDFRPEYPGIPEKEPTPYYDCEYMGRKIENGHVRIEAISNWEPPLCLVSAMSARWQDLEFVLDCTVEHERHESWHFKAGDIAIIDLWLEDIQAHEDEEAESWFVRNGEVLRWPEWHIIQWKKTVYGHPLPQWAVDPDSNKEEDPLEKMEREAEKVVGFYDDDAS